jgi:hypothetical protein
MAADLVRHCHLLLLVALWVEDQTASGLALALQMVVRGKAVAAHLDIQLVLAHHLLAPTTAVFLKQHMMDGGHHLLPRGGNGKAMLHGCQTIAQERDHLRGHTIISKHHQARDHGILFRRVQNNQLGDPRVTETGIEIIIARQIQISTRTYLATLAVVDEMIDAPQIARTGTEGHRREEMNEELEEMTFGIETVPARIGVDGHAVAALYETIETGIESASVTGTFTGDRTPWGDFRSRFP